MAASFRSYKPKVFNLHEYKTLTVLSEAILRLNEMQGAHEAKVNQFIDFQMTNDPQMEKRFRAGLMWIDDHAKLLYGKVFRSLKSKHQLEMIAALDIKSLHRPGEEKGREFFELARRYTFMGFYASDTALKKFVSSKPPPSILTN